MFAESVKNVPIFRPERMVFTASLAIPLHMTTETPKKKKRAKNNLVSDCFLIPTRTSVQSPNSTVYF